MKKALTLLLVALIVLTLAACGGNAPKAEKEQPEPEPTEEAPSDTVSANGYTVKVVAVHKTVDSNGDPLAAVELEFTNDNADPVSFMGAAQVAVFQNGVQMRADQLFLENDYDWDSYYTEIKDGATIHVFCAEPLKSDDPVEVTVDIMDYTKWTSVASTTVEMPLS